MKTFVEIFLAFLLTKRRNICIIIESNYIKLLRIVKDHFILNEVANESDNKRDDRHARLSYS